MCSESSAGPAPPPTRPRCRPMGPAGFAARTPLLSGALIVWHQPEDIELCLPPPAATTSGSINSLLLRLIARRQILRVKTGLTFDNSYLWLTDQLLVCKMRHLANINAPNAAAVQPHSAEIFGLKSKTQIGIHLDRRQEVAILLQTGRALDTRTATTQTEANPGCPETSPS
jgi:hypothetical protein